MSKLARFYGEIAKSDVQDDGTLIVTGYASSGVPDAQGETVTPEAMAKAIPEYMAFANIREMHKASAAGVALSCQVLEDGRTEIQAHIVDPVAVLKVQTGVYKGFSIGGQALKRDAINKSEIQELRLTEISLVDRPANPEAVITMFKADDIEAEQPTEPEQPAEDSQMREFLSKALNTPEFTAYVEKMIGATLAKHATGGEVTQPDPVPVIGSQPAETIVPTEVAKEIAGAPETAPAGDPINKGMYSVRSLAGILADLVWLQTDTSWEAAAEGDNSDVPARLRALATEMAGILKDMVTEETDELIAQMGTDCATCGATPCACPDPVSMSEQPTDIQKVDGQPAEDPIAKADILQKALDTMTGERDELRKALVDVTGKYDQLLKMAAPTPAARIAISKVEDNASSAESEAIDPNDTEALMRKAHQAPMKLGLV